VSDYDQFALNLLGKVETAAPPVKPGTMASYITQEHGGADFETKIRAELEANVPILVERLNKSQEMHQLPFLVPPGAPGAILVESDEWQLRLLPGYDMVNDRARCRMDVRRR
jgi:hypothetical protein